MVRVGAFLYDVTTPPRASISVYVVLTVTVSPLAARGIASRLSALLRNHIGSLKEPTLALRQLLHKTDLISWSACSGAPTKARTVRSHTPSRWSVSDGRC